MIFLSILKVLQVVDVNFVLVPCVANFMAEPNLCKDGLIHGSAAHGRFIPFDCK